MTTIAEQSYSVAVDDPDDWREPKLKAARPVDARSTERTAMLGHRELSRHRLLLEFALFNLAATALLAAAYLQGWIGTILAADTTGLTVAIFGVFVGALALAAGKLHAVSRELNCVRELDTCRGSLAVRYLSEVVGRGSGSRAITAAALRAELAAGTAIVRYLANSLVLLGLIGTVLGFIIALSGVDPERAGDVRSVGPMVSELIRGMSVALYTTLVGSVLNLWLMVNYRLLASGTVQLATEVISLGESNARPRVI